MSGTARPTLAVMNFQAPPVASNLRVTEDLSFQDLTGTTALSCREMNFIQRDYICVIGENAKSRPKKLFVA